MDLQIFDLLCPIFYPLYPNECLKIVIGDISKSASTLSFDLSPFNIILFSRFPKFPEFLKSLSNDPPIESYLKTDLIFRLLQLDHLIQFKLVVGVIF